MARKVRFEPDQLIEMQNEAQKRDREKKRRYYEEQKKMNDAVREALNYVPGNDTKINRDVDKIEKKARESGMSYGMYVALMNRGSC